MTTFPTSTGAIVQPSWERSYLNGGSSDIGRGLIVKVLTSAVDTVDLATATTDTFGGVTTEIHQVGMARSVQVDGRCPIIVGASVAIGDLLTTDGQGRAVPTTTAGKSVIGRAVTAQSTVGQLADVELYKPGSRFIVAA